MKKNKSLIADSVMVLVIALILAGGVLGVGYIRGWFGDKSADTAVLADVRGIVNMTRNGVTYPVEQDTPLRDGDEIICSPGASALVRIGSKSVAAIGEQAALTVESASAKMFAVNFSFGELFAVVKGSRNPLTLRFELGSTSWGTG